MKIRLRIQRDPTITITVQSELCIHLETQVVDGSASWQIGSGLRLDGNVLSVDTADRVEQDNTRPITSAAVYTCTGNIEALLAQI